ncbi:hypothetical protein RCZ04_03030 [Capnocytophaga sp. HP1101]
MITPLGISEAYFKLLYNIGYTMMAIIALVWAYQIDRHREDKVPALITKYVLPCFVLYALPFFVTYFVFIVGFRDVTVGTDTINYYYWMAGDVPYLVKAEVMFNWLMTILNSIGAPFTVFLLVVAVLFYGLIAYALKNLSAQYQANTFFAFFVFLSMFFSYSLATNIIRQGLSLAFLVFAYSLWQRKHYSCYLFLLLAFITHTTSIIPIVVFLVLQIVAKKIPLYYFLALYLLGIVLAYLNIGFVNIASIMEVVLQKDSGRFTTYFINDDDLYHVGFKPQFVAFTTLFLVTGLYIRNQSFMLLEHWKSHYDMLLKYYASVSFFFFMAFQIPYSDRWGLFAWIIIPLLALPYLSKDFRPKTALIASFTLIYILFELYNTLKHS